MIGSGFEAILRHRAAQFVHLLVGRRVGIAPHPSHPSVSAAGQRFTKIVQPAIDGFIDVVRGRVALHHQAADLVQRGEMSEGGTAVVDFDGRRRDREQGQARKKLLHA